tara:strand:- start:5892 stop:6500 length:609 start_codon:yes stop_codon:yes gene_type:complete
MNINNIWSETEYKILENVRINSVNLSEYHRKRYYHFKSYAKYFDLPILFLSSFSASFLMGANTYLEQDTINLIGCGFNTCITLISSVKLYLNINENMKLENDMSKEFYSLAIDIYKVLSLNPDERGESGLSYLHKKYNTYSKLVESSNLLKSRFKTDQLIVIPPNLLMVGSDTESSGSSSPKNSVEEEKGIELQENIIENNL